MRHGPALRAALTFLVFAASPVPARAAETVHLYLKANGQDIKGDSLQASLGRKDSIECVYYEQKAYTQREQTAGTVTGRRVYEPILIRKRIDKASPLIYKAFVENQRIDAVFKFFRPSPTGDGTTEQFYSVEIKDGRVETIRQFMPDALSPATSTAPPLEEITFGYFTFKETYNIGGVTHEDTWSATRSVVLPSDTTTPEALASTGPTLLVDDDASPNNRGETGATGSESDQIFAKLLREATVPFDTHVVPSTPESPQKENGPTLDELRKYQTVIWYTGRDGGNDFARWRTVTATDQAVLEAFLQLGHRRLILVSPHLLLEAGIFGSGWSSDGSTPAVRSEFIRDVIGAAALFGAIGSGSTRWIPSRAAGVGPLANRTYVIGDAPITYAQYGGVRPGTAQALLTASADPTGRGQLETVSIATVNTVAGTSKGIFLAFPLENVVDVTPRSRLELLRTLLGL